MFTLTLASLALLPAAFGLPHARQPTPAWCQGLGPASFDVAYNFTIASYNVTGPDGAEVTTGEPIVFAPTQHAARGEFVASALYRGNFSGEELDMSHGALLLPVSPKDVYASVVENAGGVPTGTGAHSASGVNASAQIVVFRRQANTDPYGGGNPCPQLAIDKDMDNLYLCMSELGQNQVVHKPTAAGASAVYPKYNLDSCYRVNLHILDDSC